MALDGLSLISRSPSLPFGSLLSGRHGATPLIVSGALALKSLQETRNARFSAVSLRPSIVARAHRFGQRTRRRFCSFRVARTLLRIRGRRYAYRLTRCAPPRVPDLACPCTPLATPLQISQIVV